MMISVTWDWMMILMMKKTTFNLSDLQVGKERLTGKTSK